MSIDETDDPVIAWMRSQSDLNGCSLAEIARHFGVAPERLRDQLRRLVDCGVLIQSVPIAGRADANPHYTLAAQ